MTDTDKYEGHTRGGWYVDDAPDVIHPTVIHENQCDAMVAELVAITGEWTEEDYANARLIADAPKLLAEVKRLRLAIKNVAGFPKRYPPKLKLEGVIDAMRCMLLELIE